MRVRMKAALSGTRDGEPWPPKGGVVDLPQAEAEHMVSIGLAAEGGDEAEPAEENTAAPADEETAVPPKPSTARKPAPKPAK